MLPHDTLDLVVSGVKSGLLRGHSSGKKKLTILHCSSWTVFNERKVEHCSVLLEDNTVISNASNSI